MQLRHALADLEHELATTRRVLERVPGEKLAWKPHPKSFSLGALATHLANLVRWQVLILEGDHFDAAGSPRMPEPTSSEEILRAFDSNAAALRERMAAVDDDALRQPWSLRNGERVIFTLPRVAALRGFGISHIVHHRGQLSVYLRLLDVPVPSIYGPSADEAPF